jgi:hypothetical protein
MTARICEVCARGSRVAGSVKPGAKRLRRLLIDQRIVALCDSHATAFNDAGGSSLTDLRKLFVENEGRRSFVDRRAPLDRRLFPPRPEGRRMAQGRRGTD